VGDFEDLKQVVHVESSTSSVNEEDGENNFVVMIPEGRQHSCPSIFMREMRQRYHMCLEKGFVFVDDLEIFKELGIRYIW